VLNAGGSIVDDDDDAAAAAAAAGAHTTGALMVVGSVVGTRFSLVSLGSTVAPAHFN